MLGFYFESQEFQTLTCNVFIELSQLLKVYDYGVAFLGDLCLCVDFSDRHIVLLYKFWNCESGKTIQLQTNSDQSSGLTH